MISGGIFDVAQKQSSLEDIQSKLSDESTWSNLELSQSLNKEKADLEKFLDLFLSVDEAISDSLDFLDIAIEESDEAEPEARWVGFPQGRGDTAARLWGRTWGGSR